MADPASKLVIAPPEQHAMPLIIINLGGEMLYILQQRLVAQKIAPSKAVKVIDDVTSAMFAKEFIAELFKPHTLYSSVATMEIFNKIAHSSIMRLNTNSMSKLYDLMTMGVKYQVSACSYPAQILRVTLNHINNIRRAVAPSSIQVLKLVKDAEQRVLDMYSVWQWGDWILGKQAILRFFGDRKVKVSLLLQNGLQSSDGHVNIDHEGVLPPHTQTPGRVSYHEDGDRVTRVEQVLVANAENVSVCANEATRDTNFELGGDLYVKYRSNGVPVQHFKPPPPTSPPPPEVLKQQAEQRRAGAQAELTLLTSLIPTARVADDDTFTLSNLFANAAGVDDDMFATAGGGDGTVVSFDGQSYQQQRKNELTGRMFGGSAFESTDDSDDTLNKQNHHEYNPGDSGGGDDDADDLLALMDDASLAAGY